MKQQLLFVESAFLIGRESTGKLDWMLSGSRKVEVEFMVHYVLVINKRSTNFSTAVIYHTQLQALLSFSLLLHSGWNCSQTDLRFWKHRALQKVTGMSEEMFYCLRRGSLSLYDFCSLWLIDILVWKEMYTFECLDAFVRRQILRVNDEVKWGHFQLYIWYWKFLVRL